MSYRKNDLILMLGLVFQIMGILLSYFYGTSIENIFIFLLGGLISIVVLAIEKWPKVQHNYLMLSIVLGILIMWVFLFIFKSNTLALLNMVNYAVCFLTVAFNTKSNLSYQKRAKKRVLPETLPETIILDDSFDETFNVNNDASFKPYNNSYDASKPENIYEKIRSAAAERIIKKNVKKEQKDFVDSKFVALDGKDIFHTPNCRMLSGSIDSDLEHFKYRQEALARGLNPCKICKP